jgi:hypothetical protein
MAATVKRISETFFSMTGAKRKKREKPMKEPRDYQGNSPLRENFTHKA